MEFNITIQGKGGHGSRPDLSCNPVDCFAAVYGALQTVGCEITAVDGGTAGNIIPDALHFTGTCKDMDTAKRILEHTCAAYNCTVVFN
jgi:metal-dependent amidase/aminoacylase/carboxypeptidase family protein